MSQKPVEGGANQDVTSCKVSRITCGRDRIASSRAPSIGDASSLETATNSGASGTATGPRSPRPGPPPAELATADLPLNDTLGGIYGADQRDAP
jgi:hypothetical protein